ncbi:NADP-dependent oxidoreductase [Rhodococcus sp. IEGM 1307]|uniref:quinone oxidoreductase family protein n=1 Tax=Rhodococcus sp. IEGM 1307 TaxID=3047091 RepID=UPI0024B79132|nr:NADP-dependent oxidoreductase [Rhodococcus sp. IEGM 1307]MDI9978635.1 NADP-dependent oxidoreductase [Rhodococcus sp. IEGM 1307]
MKAIALETYGGPDVLHPVDLPDPHPGPGQVRIQVHAAAVAPVDAMLRTGLLAEMNAGLNPPFVPGMEVAGVVDEVGDDIDPALAVEAGQKVVGFVDNLGAHGGYSDYVVLPAASVTRIPEGASAPEAASFINNSMTALNALEALHLPAGATLLVTGAAGSVGGYLAQLAHHAGLRVITIAGSGDDDLVRSFGADQIVHRGPDAAREVVARVPGGVDAVADAALLGDDIVGAIRDGGQLATFRPYHGDPGRGIRVHGLNVRQRATDHPAITHLRDLVNEGVLTMRVGTVLPAAEAPEAHRLLDAGGVRDRIILEFPVHEPSDERTTHEPLAVPRH